MLGNTTCSVDLSNYLLDSFTSCVKVYPQPVDNSELLVVAPFCVISVCLFAKIANLQRLLIGWLDAVSEDEYGAVPASLDKSFDDVVIANNRRFTVHNTRRWRIPKIKTETTSETTKAIPHYDHTYYARSNSDCHYGMG